MTIDRLMNPNANEKPLEPVGSEQARKRNAAYLGRVIWKFHAEYFQHQLERAYHLEDGRPCALYRCKIEKLGKVCYSINLDGIKAQVRNQLNEGAGCCRFEVGKKYYTLGGGECIVTGRTPCYISAKFIFGEYDGLEVRLRVKSLNGVEYTSVIRGLQANQEVVQ